ncbi:MAG: 4-alpha-glucanotransferase, partial [Muribaculaceae bacterium]|nr:4-alpha-glucanotransferase [Muribaculaceae bacterium]
MNINFNINYRTLWGESVYIVGNIPELGNNDDSKAIKMNLTGVETWRCEISVARIRKISYRFFVKTDSGSVRKEWGKPHTLNIGPGVKTLVVKSQWQDCPGDKQYYSSALLNAINKRDIKSKEDKISPNTLFISVNAPHISTEETLKMCGDCDALGNWNPEKALSMNDFEFPLWSIGIAMHMLPEEFKYKFIIVNKSTNKLVAWEDGEDRYIKKENIVGGAEVVEGLRFYDTLQNWKAAGIAIPVFSLRSEEDFGVGDFYDLKKMIDWATETGQSFVQILPINDTTMTHTWRDSYPYNANSTFALHPMYLRLEAVGKLKNVSDIKHYNTIREELNKLPEVDYERVN